MSREGDIANESFADTEASDVVNTSAEDSKLQDGEYNAALQQYFKLPSQIRRRVRALKKLQHESVKHERDFFWDVFQLELKYHLKHKPLYEKRSLIVSGDVEPNDDDCNFLGPSIEDVIEKMCSEVEEKAVISKSDTDVKGIPEFWLQAMRNISFIDAMIEDYDVNILKYLIDINCTLNDGEEPGFTLEFRFAANPYFSNNVLTKRYFFSYAISTDEPLDYEGPEIIRTKGCVINWNPGKDVTVKLIKKVQKRKSGNAKRTVTKSEQQDSFFNFFDPPLQTLSPDLDEDTQMLLESDFKMGHFIRDSLIPRAVLYFTGEAIESDSEEEDDDDDEDEDEDDDDDDEDAEDVKNHSNARGRQQKRFGHHSPSSKAAAAEDPQCKQQ